MTRPRSTLVSVQDTPYYHCIGRCVRRAYLCGEDVVTGKSFAHRRQWMLERLKLLTETFAIELCAYARTPEPVRRLSLIQWLVLTAHQCAMTRRNGRMPSVSSVGPASRIAAAGSTEVALALHPGVYVRS